MRLLLHRWACSRCGSFWPNSACWCCREEEPERDTPDDEGGSLL